MIHSLTLRQNKLEHSSMASEPSTRQRLHSVLDDLELISKELLEQLALPKSQKRPDAPDTTDLMELLLEKDNELKDLLKIADEQEKVQRVMDNLKADVTKRDGEIRQLQRTLKEAETIMATAVYQAKQKLAAVRQAQNNKVSSEDLIKYAHRISASNAVAAPPTWGPGDPRRPYPTDLEMRHSFLAMGGALAEPPPPGPALSRMYSQEAQPTVHHSHPHSQQTMGHHHPHHSHHTGQQQQHQQQQSLTPHQHHHHSTQQQQAPASVGTYSWQSSQEGPSSLTSSGGHHELKVHTKEEDDVELMSSDSSSSSSSDE